MTTGQNVWIHLSTKFIPWPVLIVYSALRCRCFLGTLQFSFRVGMVVYVICYRFWRYAVSFHPNAPVSRQAHTGRNRQHK